MKHYKSTFRLTNGEPFPPRHVNAKIDPSGVLRAYWRGPGYEELPRGAATIPGVRLLRMVQNTVHPAWVVEVTARFWDTYRWLRHGGPQPAANGAEPVVGKGGLVPGSWDALISHYKAHSRSWNEDKSAKTQKGYDTYLNLISRVLGPHKVAKTRQEDIEALIATKRTDRNGGAKQLRTTLAMLCEHARKAPLKWIEANPVRDIAKPKSKNKLGLHTLTEAEVETVRRAYPDHASDERALLEIGVAFGPRAGDLCRLGWKNIANGVISFMPDKTEESTGAEVVLPVEGEHLLAVLAHRSKTDTYFFQQPPKGSNQWNRHKIVVFKHAPWDYTRARKTWKAMRELAGIGDKPTLHSMRKCFATRMANAGANPQDIADALGDTLESAMIYTRLRDKRAGSARAFRAALAA